MKKKKCPARSKAKVKMCPARVKMCVPLARKCVWINSVSRRRKNVSRCVSRSSNVCPDVLFLVYMALHGAKYGMIWMQIKKSARKARRSVSSAAFPIIVDETRGRGTGRHIKHPRETTKTETDPTWRLRDTNCEASTAPSRTGRKRN